MNRIVALSANEQKALFKEAAKIKKIPESMIEKDFWVCFVLERLFADKELKRMFRFKGGTSLSKVFHTIERFSEDIDLILDWRLVSQGEPLADRSKTQQDKFNKATEQNAEDFISSVLKEKIQSVLEDVCSVSSDEKDRHILNITYPETLVNPYLKAGIKLEIGPFASWLPNDEFPVISYVGECLPELSLTPFNVPTILAERTFWEKITILHSEANRPKDSLTPARYSRHYYDVYRLGHSEYKDKALNQLSLLKETVSFKSKFYPSARAHYETAVIGTLRLIPNEENRKRSEQDYKAMREMIFGEIPDWNDILSFIADLEKEINGIKGA